MFSTAFYPASFQQPPPFGGEFHHPSQPSHLPPRGPHYGEFHFSYAGPLDVSPPGTGGSYPPTPGLPGFGIVYGFFAPPPPAFGMHPPPWAFPYPPPFFCGPPGNGLLECRSGSPPCGFHTMRPLPCHSPQRCSCCMAQNSLSEHPGEYYGPRYPVGDGAEFPLQPPAPQAYSEPSPPSAGGDEQSLPVRFSEDHQLDRHDKEMNEAGRNDESQEREPRPTSPAHHERRRSGHGKRHAHGPPPAGQFHGPHAVGPRPPPPPSCSHFPDRRGHGGPYPFEGFGHHAPPMPPPPLLCGQSRAPPCSFMQNEHPDPSCVGPQHPPPMGHFGRLNCGHPRRGTSIGRGHFDHRHKGRWGRHGPPHSSGSKTDPNYEDHDEFGLPVGEANEADSDQKAGREDEWEGVEHDERTPDVVSEVTVRDGEDGRKWENERKDA